MADDFKKNSRLESPPVNEDLSSNLARSPGFESLAEEQPTQNFIKDEEGDLQEQRTEQLLSEEILELSDLSYAEIEEDSRFSHSPPSPPPIPIQEFDDPEGTVVPAVEEERIDMVCLREKLNEVISFVKSGLKDLSISRKNIKWGSCCR